ncbi:MAG: long-chain fatty acid--CoA ligase [Gammaproteobacteria bacterium]
MELENYITPAEAPNLSRLFLERVARSPDKVAYEYFDSTSAQWCELRWQEMAERVGGWQHSLRQEHLVPGDRVGIMLKNSPSWVLCEQAALGLGLVVVPLYVNDRPENTRYILNHADVKILFIDNISQFNLLEAVIDEVPSLKKIISLKTETRADCPRLQSLEDWLVKKIDAPARLELDRHSLSSIVYTSGTTGKPKGVMLSHGNILWNAYSCAQCYPFRTRERYLSFLPLSHMFERTAGYYLPMLTGGTVAYARSIDQLAEDLQDRRPTVLVTVPRIFERVYNKINLQLNSKSRLARKLFHMTVDVGWLKFLHTQNKVAWHPKLLLWPALYALVARKVMAKLGGQLDLAVSGGAPLAFEIGRFFTGLGLTISQGYGMTEASPVVCTNRVEDNDIASVGQAIPDVEVKLDEHSELLVRSPGVMLGYWNNDEATHEVIDADGWLHTGDKAKIEGGHIYITGRLKDIIVLSNGEKVPPSDIELAICADPLFEQVMVIGEGKPFLSALVVLNEAQFATLCTRAGIKGPTEPNNEAIKKHLLQRINATLEEFPGYAKIYRFHAMLEPWSVDNDMITPTLKLKRQVITEKHRDDIAKLYVGH